MSKTSQKEMKEKLDKKTTVELLKSALSYMQDAGFEIIIAENDGYTWLGIPEIADSPNGIVFTGQVTPKNDEVTPIQENVTPNKEIGVTC